MDAISLDSLYGGIIKIRSNAHHLIDEAEILFKADRFSRAFVLAYTACEELGKIPIVFGAAAREAAKVPVDWKAFNRRYRSHTSKATQFLSLNALISRVTGRSATSNDLADVIKEVANALATAPEAIKNRNVGLYCDFKNGSFFLPDDRITPEVARNLMSVAKTQLAAANSIFGPDVQTVETEVRKYAESGQLARSLRLVQDFLDEE